MKSPDSEFHQRVSEIPFHGLGLSVDVYSPNLVELIGQLEQQELSFGYLEIFKAEQRVLEYIRSRYPSVCLEYHADGLWVTQPDWKSSYRHDEELDLAASHVQHLGCSWLNQECATKQIAGHSFGTYLPPLFSDASARTTAANVQVAQQFFDERVESDSLSSPLFLLETPPLTYFAIGEMAYPDFFCAIAEECSCGFVLDIGHVWTVYRYTDAWQESPIEQFLEGFLRSFPLERVVEVHIAGLGFHPVVPRQGHNHGCPPNWVDSHDAPIPEVLFAMLDQVLSHPRLVNAKAVGMEVDTKPIPSILQEFRRLRQQYSKWEQGQGFVQVNMHPHCRQKGALSEISEMSLQDSQLEAQYQQFVEMLTQSMDNPWLNESDLQSALNKTGMDVYRQDYLPYEIFEWGGNLNDMFPNTMQALESSGEQWKGFLRFWYSHPHSFQGPYDFFLLKVHYFVEFIRATYPQYLTRAVHEATDLRHGYALACQSTPSQHSF